MRQEVACFKLFRRPKQMALEYERVWFKSFEYTQTMWNTYSFESNPLQPIALTANV